MRAAGIALALVMAGIRTAASAPAPVTHAYSIPVLMYHRVANLHPREARSSLVRDLTVTPARFEHHVRYLTRHGFALLTVREIEQAIASHRPLPLRAAAITFDDGYRDNYDRALPILRRYRAPATVFVVTGTVGSPGHLTWAQIAEMRRAGVEIASHTVWHPDLPGLERDELDRELRGSRRSLRVRAGLDVRSLAYPSGRYSATVVARLRAAGYRAAWRKDGGPVTPDADAYHLPRVRVAGDLSVQRLIGVVERAVARAVPERAVRHARR